VTIGSYFILSVSFTASKDAGDALFLSDNLTNSMNGARFSTWDHDDDSSVSRHCARDMQAGWWFSSCGFANPNGLWQPNDPYDGVTAPSIWWGSTLFKTYAVKSIDIKLKVM